jgi:hypothetical protein
MTTAFVDVESYMPEMDVVPDLDDVQYPCRVCGKEAGPYGGRGPKPKLCSDHKTQSKGTRAPKVTGKDANLAAQATGVLVQLNAILALGVSAIGLFQTGGAIASANETFEQAAYLALQTDPELCKLILKSGAKSAKVSLALAYGGMAMSVGPTAVNELRERKADRDAKREADDFASSGYGG